MLIVPPRGYSLPLLGLLSRSSGGHGACQLTTTNRHLVWALMMIAAMPVLSHAADMGDGSSANRTPNTTTASPIVWSHFYRYHEPQVTVLDMIAVPDYGLGARHLHELLFSAAANVRCPAYAYLFDLIRRAKSRSTSIDRGSVLAVAVDVVRKPDMYMNWFRDKLDESRPLFMRAVRQLEHAGVLDGDGRALPTWYSVVTCLIQYMAESPRYQIAADYQLFFGEEDEGVRGRLLALLHERWREQHSKVISTADKRTISLAMRIEGVEMFAGRYMFIKSFMLAMPSGMPWSRHSAPRPDHADALPPEWSSGDYDQSGPRRPPPGHQRVDSMQRQLARFYKWPHWPLVIERPRIVIEETRRARNGAIGWRVAFLPNTSDPRMNTDFVSTLSLASQIKLVASQMMAHDHLRLRLKLHRDEPAPAAWNKIPIKLAVEYAFHDHTSDWFMHDMYAQVTNQVNKALFNYMGVLEALDMLLAQVKDSSHIDVAYQLLNEMELLMDDMDPAFDMDNMRTLHAKLVDEARRHVPDWPPVGVAVSPTTSDEESEIEPVDSPRTIDTRCMVCRELMSDRQFLTRALRILKSNRQLTCGHKFHNKCIDSWLSYRTGNKACPICRQP